MNSTVFCKGIKNTVLGVTSIGNFYSESMVVRNRLAKHVNVDHNDFSTTLLETFVVEGRDGVTYHALVHFNGGCVHVKVNDRSSCPEIGVLNNSFSIYGFENKELIDRLVVVVASSLAMGFPIRTAVTAINMVLDGQIGKAMELLDLIEQPVKERAEVSLSL